MPELIQKYDCLLFDAFGVLMDDKGLLPKVKELFDHLHNTKKNYFILTNGSKFNLKKTAESYKKRGLEIPVENIISSGSLISDWFTQNELKGEKCFVIGPDSSKEIVAEAGGIVLGLKKIEEAHIFIIGNQDDDDLIKSVDATISAASKRMNQRKEVTLLLPNPDLIYPTSHKGFGITAGSIANMIENALKLIHPNSKNTDFIKLGKPFKPIFEKALAKAHTQNMVMIGDQIATDIAGAEAFGIDSALISTGLTDTTKPINPKNPQPTYILKSLSF